MRKARLRSYNDYREAYGLKPMTEWTQLTRDTAGHRAPRALYGDIERLEWYVGIFAEELPRLHDDG